MSDHVEEAKELALKVAAATVAAEAKSVIGTYKYDWPQLAASAQAELRKAFSETEREGVLNTVERSGPGSGDSRSFLAP